MPFVRNLWYMAAWSREIGETVFERTIAGRALQMIRRSHGELVVTHAGWQLACVERHTAVWVWLGAPAAADPTRIADLSFLEDRANGRYNVTLPVHYGPVNDLLLSSARLAGLCVQRDAAAIEGLARTDIRRVIADWAVHGATLLPQPGQDKKLRHCNLTMQMKWAPPSTLCISGTVVSPEEPPLVWIDAWVVSPVDEASSICFYSLGNAPDKAARHRSALTPDEIDTLVGKRKPAGRGRLPADDEKSAAAQARAVMRELFAAEAGQP